MKRRRFLELAAVALPFVAGCTSEQDPANSIKSDPSTDTPSPTPTHTSTQSPSPTESPTETPDPTESPRQNPDTIFVDPGGSDHNNGAKNNPLGSLQTALDRVQPGERIYVEPGIYSEKLITKRSGEPGKPIIITGPREAIVRPPPDKLDGRVLDIVHSHVHLTGLTLNGLHDPAQEKNPGAYAGKVVECSPPTWENNHPDYLTNVKIMPNAIGNARSSIISHIRTNMFEVGEFELIGPAGVQHLYGDESGHVGEVVSLGISADNINSSWYEWNEPDQSNDVHAHHIANLEGYSHTELVEVHQGMYDVTIEYCTDLGGSGKYRLDEDDPPSDEAAMALRGAKSTLRWCIIEDGNGAGVHVGNSGLVNKDEFRALPEERFPGINNSVYRNRLMDLEGLAIAFPAIRSDADIDNGPDDQEVICGNEFNGDTQDNPASACPDSVPETGQIGHLGGDSPWRDSK